MGIEVKQEACIIDGVTFPAVGYGTFPLKDEVCYQAVLQAGKAGYRIIDTATYYKNLTPIGKALKEMGREKFYVISKVWPDSQTAAGIENDIAKTLKELQTDHLDAYLLHWPNSRIPIEESLGKMESLRKQGLIRHIGLSNVTINHLKRALELNIPISWVQVEMHPDFYDPELIRFCQEHGIVFQAWSPLSRGGLANDKMLNRIGKKYGKTPAQIALKWILQHHCVPLPGSKNENHMKQNLNLDFTLSPDDMAKIDQRVKAGQRVRLTPEWNFGFTDEFDFTYAQCWPKAK